MISIGIIIFLELQGFSFEEFTWAGYIEFVI